MCVIGTQFRGVCLKYDRLIQGHDWFRSRALVNKSHFSTDIIGSDIG